MKAEELEERLDDMKSALELAQEEVERLEGELSAYESKLADLKSSMREVCA